MNANPKTHPTATIQENYDIRIPPVKGNPEPTKRRA